jgi:PhoPQ-activated pathogenicity-related protein
LSLATFPAASAFRFSLRRDKSLWLGPEDIRFRKTILNVPIVPAHILRIVDPYSYRDRLTMPKFIMNASGDQYFPTDSSTFYFDDLPGVKYLRYVPNANHSLKDTDAPASLLAFYRAIVKGAAMPKFSWKIQPDGSIRVQTEDKPLEVNLWQATNPKARDFRLDTIGKAYTKSTLIAENDGVYIAKVKKPATGWTAFFVELVFASGAQEPYKFSTQVHIVPDVLPHSYEEFKKSNPKEQKEKGQ